MVRGCTVAFWVLAFPLLGFGETLVGIVVDPQHRVIEGAEVTLSCGANVESRATDSQGRFTFPAQRSFSHCSIGVTYAGFEAFKQLLDHNPAPLAIELRLAVTKQVVNVRSNESEEHDLREIDRSSLGSASLSDADLRGISNNTADLICYAKAFAGADSAQDAIYVDGLPSATLPPVAMVGRIDVNTDPFSAEYSDNDQTHINIATKSADRHLRFNFGGAGLGVGGNNPLAPGLQSVSHSANLGLTGPVPNAPLTFSLHANVGSYVNEQPIEAVTPPGLDPRLNPGNAPVTNQNGSGLVNLHYAAGESSQMNFSYSEWRSTGSNVGVGGLTLPRAGSDSQSLTHEARVTFTKAGTAYLYRGGMVLNEGLSTLQADSTSLGLTVAGSFIAGGAALASNQSRHTSWTWKNVIQSGSKRRFWTAGLTLTRSGLSNDERPNPNGVFEFSTLQAYTEGLAGQPTGTWFFTRGNGRAHYSSVEAAPFMQGDLFHSENLLITGGMRADYQTGGGVLWSPRLSAAAKARRFILRAGAGMFVHDWPGDIFLHTIEDDGLHLQPFILEYASLADVLSPPGPGQLVTGPLVRSRLAPDLMRPRDWMFKGSVERPFGHLTPGLEYTWTDGLHQLGSQRLADQGGWMDALESNCARHRQELHARLRYALKRQSIVAHYEWFHSRDDTDGPFSFPEYQDNLRAEWARTAGVSPHNFTLVDNLRLPRAISVMLMATERSSAPYNITSGLDNGDGLYNDRGGRVRNNGNGPSYRSLALFGSRRIPVPGTTTKSGDKIYVNVGVQADNLLGNRNYFSLDSVAASPLFGRPLAASPGRSVRLWFNLD